MKVANLKALADLIYDDTQALPYLEQVWDEARENDDSALLADAMLEQVDPANEEAEAPAEIVQTVKAFMAEKGYSDLDKFMHEYEEKDGLGSYSLYEHIHDSCEGGVN